MTFTWNVLLASMVVGHLATAAEPAGFREKLLPLLERRCFDCHSAKVEEVKGKLKLDTWEDVLKGGSRGAAIEPGKLDSLLLKAIRYEEGDLQMPPRGKLKGEEIQAIEAWVQQWKG